VGDLATDGGCDPVAGGQHAVLVAGGAEASRLASEGEESFVAAIRALATCEPGCEVAAAQVGLDDSGRWHRRNGWPGSRRRKVCSSLTSKPFLNVDPLHKEVPPPVPDRSKFRPA
jgi:hypothetical protein